MIIAIVVNEQTKQASFSFEPNNPVVARNIMADIVAAIDQQIGANGQPKSRLIIPPTVVPGDITKRTDDNA